MSFDIKAISMLRIFLFIESSKKDSGNTWEPSSNSQVLLSEVFFEDLPGLYEQQLKSVWENRQQ